MVFRHRAYRRQHPRGHRHLLQPECRRRRASGHTRPITAVPRIRTGRSKTPARRVTWQMTPRNKLAMFWDAQALCRTCTGATPGLAEPQRISPEAVGVLGRPLHVTQAAYSAVLSKQRPRRGELRRHVLRRRELRARAESDARSRPRRRAVRDRLRGERRHSGARLPLAGFQRRTHRFVPVAGVAVPRDRDAQPAHRLSAYADDRRPDVDDEQPEPDLPRQQRRAEPADAVDLPVGERRAGRLGRRCSPRTDGRAAA